MIILYYVFFSRQMPQRVYVWHILVKYVLHQHVQPVPKKIEAVRMQKERIWELEGYVASMGATWKQLQDEMWCVISILCCSAPATVDRNSVFGCVCVRVLYLFCGFFIILLNLHSTFFRWTIHGTVLSLPLEQRGFSLSAVVPG